MPPTPGSQPLTFAELAELDDDALAAHYAYPPTSTPYLRVNFIASADGAASLDGLSGGLGSAADKRVFGMLRRLADVVLVGAGTARAEGYRGARRPTIGSATPPPIAVVTGSADLDPAGPLFTDTAVAPIVFTLPSSPARRRAAITEAGGEVVVLDALTPRAIMDELGRRGRNRVLCEGGPSLFGDLIAADVVDELCLSVSPTLAGGTAPRIAHSTIATPRALRLAGALHDCGMLLLRYRRADPIE